MFSFSTVFLSWQAIVLYLSQPPVPATGHAPRDSPSGTPPGTSIAPTAAQPQATRKLNGVFGRKQHKSRYSVLVFGPRARSLSPQLRRFHRTSHIPHLASHISHPSAPPHALPPPQTPLRRRAARELDPAAFLRFSPDKIILYPSREPLGSIGAARRTIPFQNGELEIFVGRSAAHAAGASPDLYVLRFYGNADRADPNVGLEAREWTAAPSVETWGGELPRLRRQHRPARNCASIGPAALAAYDALKRQAGSRPIIAFGTSLGTTAALHVAAHRPWPASSCKIRRRCARSPCGNSAGGTCGCSPVRSRCASPPRSTALATRA